MRRTSLAQMIQGRKAHTIQPDATIRSACIAMTSVNVGALPVIAPDGALLGILSERDVIQRSVIVYRPSDSTKVRQVMTPNPKWLPPDAKPEEALTIMLKGRFRHLPVCEHGRLVGIVSMRDFNPSTSSFLDRLRGKPRSSGITVEVGV